MSKLVSIISPCYNGENYVRRFIESVLNQTYDNIEFIIVNDGSIDDTERIILSYKDRFLRKGYNFVYIYQENAGQSAAINQALKVFTGDYMTWPDSDDALTLDAIEKRVAFLEIHPEYGMLICKTEVVEENTFKHIGYQQRIKPKEEDDLLYDLIMGKNVYYSPGGYMVRSTMFRAAMPVPLEIQAFREIGQNYQLMLPIAFKYPCGYIDDVCYLYTIRKNSHSRTKHTFEQQMDILRISNEVLSNIAKGLNADTLQNEKIEKTIEKRRLMQLLFNMLLYNKKEGVESVIKELKLIDEFDSTAKNYVLRLKFPFYNLAYRLLCKMRSMIKVLASKNAV